MRVAAMWKISKHIVSEIRQGNDGSMNANFFVPVEGFMVGGYSWTMVGQPELFDQDLVFSYLANNESFLFDSDSHFVGWWTDNGKVYLDMSVNLFDREYAGIQGRNNNEIAIWDLTNAAEIRL